MREISRNTRRLPTNDPHGQLEAFLGQLFAPTDVVAIRAIETWQREDKRASRLSAQAWLTPDELVGQYSRFLELNEKRRANIYFSVCPRRTRSTNEVDTVRCLWADIDHREPDDVLSSLPTVVPRPSVIVASGHGTHLYWRLSAPVKVADRESRDRVEGLLRNIYVEIGGDKVQDVTRLLRLPGFWNTKCDRNSVPRKACTLHQVNDVTHSLSAFEPWTFTASQQVRLDQESMPAVRRDLRTQRRIERLVRRLRYPSRDRSARDFAVVCSILRLGATPEEVRQMLAGSGLSKFGDVDNPQYTDRTIANACRAVGLRVERVE